ncbi:MAG TPA: glycosyltransferase family A protein [Candidatus Limnocylindrales bacterium]|jgi:hypothetical protein|nr:glycosyltransferase family A protein [Candidatus Limnocylindrales bacterium]
MPEVSVVVPSIQGWPAIAQTLEAIRDQADGRPVEVVVVDGSDRPEPPEDARWPGLRWLRAPGRSTYQLRPLGYRATSGSLVAVTEDHCIPAADWIERIVAAHAAYPRAAVVGGAIENASPEQVVARAAFLVTHTRFMPPLPRGPAEHLPGPANLSFKRHVLERIPEHGSLGVVEGFDGAALAAEGEILILDDRIRVGHRHAFDLREESAIQFHDGRTAAGFRRTVMDRRDWLRLAALGLLPFARSLRGATTATRKGVPPRRVAGALPLIVWLQLCHALGELVGYASGPGTSPGKLV